MNAAFAYQDGALQAENVPLARIAAEIGTPFYCYSAAKLRQNYRDFYQPLAALKPTLYYAIKANPSLAVTKILKDCGAGADITSLGELTRALTAGIDPQKIIFAGVGKQPHEMQAALQAGIRQFNVESIPELKALSAVASSLGRVAELALRVNPDVDARTHHKISTGEIGSKFGIDHAQLPAAMALAKTLPGLSCKGFQVHIGSHVFDYAPFQTAYTRLAAMVRDWRAAGYAVERLDLGGGVGIPYDGETLAPFSDYAAIVHQTVGDLGVELAFEPGRRLVGDAGLLVTKIIYDKQGAARRFLIVDAGMNDLLRPAMYEARHSILPVKESAAAAVLADVVGPVCETSDLFGKDYALPGAAPGDLLAILQAGAYGSAMSSTYNGRALIAEVLVDGDSFRLTRRRIEVEEQLGWEEG